jgi:iron complex outermembrane receptor protein
LICAALHHPSRQENHQGGEGEQSGSDAHGRVPKGHLLADGLEEVRMTGVFGTKHWLMAGTALTVGIAGLQGQACAQAPAATAPAADQVQASEAKPQDIVVTGSYLGNIRQENRASPILAVDNAAIERTGSSSIGDLTRFIPQNVGSTGGLQDLSKGGADRAIRARPICAGWVRDRRWCCSTGAA